MILLQAKQSSFFKDIYYAFNNAVSKRFHLKNPGSTLPLAANSEPLKTLKRQLLYVSKVNQHAKPHVTSNDHQNAMSKSESNNADVNG